MAKPTGFLEHQRQMMKKRPVAERICDCAAIEQLMAEGQLQEQSSRCMDCGIPFCHNMGCPLVNLIPEWNDLVYRKQWRRALELLHKTNNFPEFTGRICPAPCEASCTLGASEGSEAVTIRQIELHLVEKGFKEGWIAPQPAPVRTGRRVAVVGSGPAGLAAAQQLARAGHDVVVYEAADRIGGLLRYGIPDFKLEKTVIDRRLEQMRGEGVVFETGVKAGEDVSMNYLCKRFDAVLLAGGARVPRDIAVPGRQLSGIHFAMDFLTQQNRRVAGDIIPAGTEILAKGKHVVVVGGGDTGADCVGTSIRQGALSVTQIEILPKPPPTRDPATPWPLWPNQLRTSSSHEEGCDRRWNIQTKEFLGKDGQVRSLKCCEVEWKKDPATGRQSFADKPGSDFELPAGLVLLSMGFTKEGNAEMLKKLGMVVTPAGEPQVDASGMSSIPGVFVAGDLAWGASLVVRAIADGRKSADRITAWLAGK